MIFQEQKQGLYPDCYSLQRSFSWAPTSECKAESRAQIPSYRRCAGLHQTHGTTESLEDDGRFPPRAEGSPPGRGGPALRLQVRRPQTQATGGCAFWSSRKVAWKTLPPLLAEAHDALSLEFSPRETETHVHTKTCARVFTSAWCTRAKRRSNPEVRQLRSRKQNVVCP